MIVYCNIFRLHPNEVVLERIGMQNAEGLDVEKEDEKKGRRTAYCKEY
jgi:hypothetical protein